jgi:hypothetical protein
MQNFFFFFAGQRKRNKKKGQPKAFAGTVCGLLRCFSETRPRVSGTQTPKKRHSARRTVYSTQDSGHIILSKT